MRNLTLNGYALDTSSLSYFCAYVFRNSKKEERPVMVARKCCSATKIPHKNFRAQMLPREKILVILPLVSGFDIMSINSGIWQHTMIPSVCLFVFAKPHCIFIFCYMSF